MNETIDQTDNAATQEYEEEIEEGNEDWFFSGFGLDDDDNDDTDENEDDENDWNGLPYPNDATLVLSNLHSIMKRIGQKSDDQSIEEDYQERSRYIQSTMGSLALVRGAQGDVLREAGAVKALLSTVMEVWERLPSLTVTTIHQTNHSDNQITDPTHSREELAVIAATLDLAKNAWGAIRDLCCGNAENRRMARIYEPCPGKNGVLLATEYLQRYHEIPWPDIPQPLELGVLTAVVGVMRNLTHATGENSHQLHANGVTNMLLWRLLHGNGSCPLTNVTTTTDGSASGKGANGIVCCASLPQTSLPWRGASFRAAGTLVNMAEKCNECAIQCANHAALIHILAESWGRFDEKKKSFYLHPGMAAIIESAKLHLPPQDFDSKWQLMLDKEKLRKETAQQVEEERKQRLFEAGLSPF